jgi:methylmalonyl-CoA/ethylmalonyl-CoA epimerase
MPIDHAGIATTDADALLAQYGALFDVDVAHEETFEGMRLAFLDFGNAYFEVIEPVEESGPIAAYLDRHGPGIHHLAVAVEDAADALDRARELDIGRIDEQPRAGAWGHDVAFLDPRDTGGVLLEFVEH